MTGAYRLRRGVTAHEKAHGSHGSGSRARLHRGWSVRELLPEGHQGRPGRGRQDEGRRSEGEGGRRQARRSAEAPRRGQARGVAQAGQRSRRRSRRQEVGPRVPAWRGSHEPRHADVSLGTAPSTTFLPRPAKDVRNLRIMSDDRYPFREIETKWQRIWEDTKQFRVREDPGRSKYYCLEMFPYPSGRIHMGHVRVYAIGDVIARFKTMRGHAVLHPMGWDAFGLPAENAAIEKGVPPNVWTRDNIAYMRDQLKRLGLSYDWSREVTTCEPDYYKWNQWLFLKFFEKGLAYKKRSSVNWCPSCETVLANEQVEEGRCWRCDTLVVQKELEQWFFRITSYAEELLQGCDRLTAWPARVLAMQRNWIGKSIGVEVDFPLAEPVADLPAIRIFTTRQDTIFGATFMSLAPESPLVERLITGRPQATAVREVVARVSRQDKGV